MAEPQPCDGASASNVRAGSESSLQLNIKTLDSRVYSFDVDKNIAVSAFKEKIAGQSGVPVGQQRLIFRGKVLKDDHPLSEYNVENGDTLHLVERQPQPSSGSSSGEANSSNGNRGQDSNTGGSRHRIGPIAHSIVLGTLNVGDPGEAVVPDLSRVIGSVLSTIGIGNQAGGLQPGFPASNGIEADRSQANAGGQNQGGNQFQWQAFPGPSASHNMQIPLGAAIAVPSLNMPIPDSLSTLIEFMARMERALLRNGGQTNPSTANGSEPATELPSNSRGFPTIDGLSTVLQHAQNLLSDHVVPAISRTAARLNQDGGSNDPAVRGQVQTESIQLGMAMQHLGALFLELGRTVLTLRMGQSPADSFVNAGPAVYISPSGPNPIMVQPFPIQTSSLFGGASGVATNPMTIGPVGVASVPRNVNIHIHAGTALTPAVGSRAPNGENTQRGRVNVTGSTGSGQAHGSLGTDVAGAAVQSEPITFSVSGAAPSGTGVSSLDSSSISSIVAEINSQIRSLLANRAQNGENNVNVPESAGSGQARGLGTDVTGAAVQSEPITFSVSGVAPTGSGVSQSPDSNSMSSIVSEINSQLRRSLLANMQSGNHAPSDGSTNQEEHAAFDASVGDRGRPGNTAGETSHLNDEKAQTARHEVECEPSLNSGGDSHKRSITSDEGIDKPDGSSNIPIGLGVGGLQPKHKPNFSAIDSLDIDKPDGSSNIPIGLGVGGLQSKRRGRQPKAQTKDSGGPSATSHNQQSLAAGQHVLQSLASLSTSGNSCSPPSAQSPNVARGAGTSTPTPRQNADGEGDIADAMTEMLQGPALDGLLAGVSQQTGIGSPDMLRNMLQQFTQNPAMRNTVNQIAQQIDNHDLGSMFSGLDQVPGGGIDLSRMMQQMMPIVSKALGGASSVSELGAALQPGVSQSRSRSGMTRIYDPQTDLQLVVQRLINQGSPQEIFGSLADTALNLYSDGSAAENVVNELCSEEGLAQEFQEMLYRDISRRFHDDKES